jgi:molecular chaperone GrpE (heat shock protein)
LVGTELSQILVIHVLFLYTILMQDSIAPRLAKWPFFVANAVLLALALFTVRQFRHPIGAAEVFACLACVTLGAFFSIWPYILEYRLAAKLVESSALTSLSSVISKVQNLEQVATRIDGATSQWTSVQESADKTARKASEIAQKMSDEVKAFNEFVAKANDSEKAGMRLEVDKLRRAENDWLQVLVRILDHVHAINRAAAQSGQPNVVEQLSRFQIACHDAARRVGLTPFTAAADEKFDAQRHQVINGQPKPADGALVDETVASGYNFQGRLLRPAMVRIRPENTSRSNPSVAETSTETATASAQNQLPLG